MYRIKKLEIRVKEEKYLRAQEKRAQNPRKRGKVFTCAEEKGLKSM